ncbi:AI-2E family transporter [Roseibium alexandrii]|uniref:Transport of quorum-sensing signal protein n=1 Tax=Roseibium alexandrii TaxID=388408 RepID=A0A0M7AQL3_9HYPH|nr:AI-2E family transporter [Roseibium alexandrii]CTQ76722.1 Transport of quorum-sensing signal protein [Roseibium alexandrii]
MTGQKQQQNSVDIGGQFRTASLIILGICGLLGLLVIGRGFLVPIVVACIFTSLISAGISKLEERGLPGWASMLISVSGFFLLIYGLAQIFAVQSDTVTATLPKYAERFDQLLADLAALLGQNQVAQIRSAIAQMDFSAHIASLAESVSGLFGSLGLVLMYTAFLLSERGMLLSKLAHLFPDPDKAKEVQVVLRTVGFGIRRYMWIKTVVSLLTGGLCYLVLRYVKADFAEIQALLIFLLNFIPTIGSIVGVIIPALVTLAQFDTLTPFLIVVAVCGSVQFVVGNIIEPKFMGSTLNLSPFIVIVSLTFWGTVWGIEGAFLSVPIAASIIILCRDIPALRFVAVLMSADGDLSKGRKQPLPADQAVPSETKAEDVRIRELQEELKAIQNEGG